MKFEGFCDGLYKGRSLGLDGQECMNLYPEVSPSTQAKSHAILVGTPGLKKLTSVNSSGKCRGIYVTARERLLVVIENKLFEINRNFTTTFLGKLSTHNNRCSFAEIDLQMQPTHPYRSQVMIVDGEAGYIFDTSTNTLTQITGDYLPGISVTSQNGFFIQNLNESNKFIYSDYRNGLSWTAGENFFTAESNPDPIKFLTILNNQLWLVGSKTTEIWNYTGDINQLWTRSGIGYIMTGVASNYGVTTITGNILWVGSGSEGQDIIWMSGPSYAPTRISTHAIEYILSSQIGDISDCEAMSYQQEGHLFAIFNFPKGNRTLVYDITTGLWHERSTFNSFTGTNDHHICTYVVNWQGNVIVGTEANPNLYEWSIDQYTDDGAPIQRVRVAPHLQDERHRLYFSELEVDLEKGVGLQSYVNTVGHYPQIMLEWSNDGGFHYQPVQLWTTAGAIGDHLVRVRWAKLGMSRDRVFKLTMTDPVRWSLTDARIVVQEERA